MKQRIVQVPDAAWLMGILWIGLALRLPLLAGIPYSFVRRAESDALG